MRHRRENKGDFGDATESLLERSLRERKHRSMGVSKGKLVVLVTFFMIVIGMTLFIVKKCSSSKVVMDLKDFYKTPEGKVMVVLHDEISENMGLYEDDKVYLPYSVVKNHINKRFYFDSAENILSFVTANEIIRAEVGSSNYSVNRSKTEVGYPIVKTEGEDVYLALDFVKEFADVKYEFFNEPNRVVIDSDWGKNYSYYKVKKAAKLRRGPSKKADILANLEENDTLCVLSNATEVRQQLEGVSTEGTANMVFVDDPVQRGYVLVMTKDGVIGYAPTKSLSEVYKEKLKGGEKEVVFPHTLKDKTINMTWHQVTTEGANSSLLNDISSTKGLNCISPTWYSIASNEGTIASIASESYVKKAHSAGLEVWALCDDFKASTDEIDLMTVLGKTSNRDKLINALIASAIQNNLDGINIDFENISVKTADAYLEFLREMSVKCRNNGLILSVDSYVPSNYTSYYDREEQGKVVDYVVVMAYDEHYSGSEESGSVASIGFVEDAVNSIVKLVDSKQVIIAMPFYTRLWKETEVDGEIKVSSSAHSMNQAKNILANNDVKAEWDKVSGQYYGEYVVGQDVYKIWLEEEKSIEEKLKVIFKDRKEGKVAGISSWKLTLEKPDIWNIILKYVN